MERRELRAEINRAFGIVAAVAITGFIVVAVIGALNEQERARRFAAEASRRSYELSEELAQAQAKARAGRLTDVERARLAGKIDAQIKENEAAIGQLEGR